MKSILASFFFCAVLSIPVFAGRSLPLIEGKPVSDSGFLSLSGVLPAYPARVTLFPSSDALTVTVRQMLPPGTVLNVKGSVDEPEKVFHGDAIELFLAPHPEAPQTYYQFGVNPEGALYQAKGADTSWRPAKPVTVAVEQGKDFWEAVFHIPYGAFGETPPKKGTVWRGNFVCGGINWAHVGDLHTPSAFGELVFGGEENALSVEELTFRDGKFNVKLKVNSGVPLQIKINGENCVAEDGKQEWSKGAVVSKEFSSGADFGDYEIPHKNIMPFVITATFAGSGENVFSLDAIAGGDQPGWLILNQFYYKALPDLKLQYDAVEFGTSVISVCGVGNNYLKVVLRGPAKGEFMLDGILPGEYLFRIDDGKKHTSCGFVVLSPENAETLSFTQENRLTLSKESPYALFVTEPDGTLRPFYPILTEGPGQWLSTPSPSAYSFVYTPAVGYLFAAETEKKLQHAANIIAQYAKDPRALFRISYEAQMAVMEKSDSGEIKLWESSAAFYENLYKMLKEKYPGVLFSIQTDGQLEFARFAGNCDVFETAYWGSSYAPTMLLKLPRDLAETRETAGRKPVLFWLGGSLPSGEIRTADELRAAIRLCILHDISGNIIHLGHGSIPKSRTRVWSLLEGIQAETAVWYPAWVKGTPLSIPVYGESFETAVRSSGGKTLLLAVNLSPYENSFSFTYPEKGTRREILLPGYGTVLLEMDESGKILRSL